LLLVDRLKGSKYDTKEYIASVMRVFENQVKRCVRCTFKSRYYPSIDSLKKFKGDELVSFIPLDGSGESDETRGIIRGRLKFTR